MLYATRHRNMVSWRWQSVMRSGPPCQAMHVADYSMLVGLRPASCSSASSSGGEVRCWVPSCEDLPCRVCDRQGEKVSSLSSAQVMSLHGVCHSQNGSDSAQSAMRAMLRGGRDDVIRSLPWSSSVPERRTRHFSGCRPNLATPVEHISLRTAGLCEKSAREQGAVRSRATTSRVGSMNSSDE